MDAINKTLECKLAWNILTTEDSIWTRLMHDKYLKNKTSYQLPLDLRIHLCEKYNEL